MRHDGLSDLTREIAAGLLRGGPTSTSQQRRSRPARPCSAERRVAEHTMSAQYFETRRNRTQRGRNFDRGRRHLHLDEADGPCPAGYKGEAQSLQQIRRVVVDACCTGAGAKPHGRTERPGMQKAGWRGDKQPEQADGNVHRGEIQ